MAELRIVPEPFAKRYRRNAENLLKLTRDLPDDLPPETIHDLRVTVRRIQVLRRLLPKKTRRSRGSKMFDFSLKSFLKATSQIRDLDTLVITLKTGKASLPDELLRSLGDERSHAAMNVRAAMKTISKARAPAISPSQIDGKKLSRRLRRRFDARSQSVRGMLKTVLKDESKIGELHALRIAVKKLRYLLELVDKNTPESSVLAEWQGSLGLIHDLDVAEAYVQSNRWGFAKESTLRELRRRRHLGYLRFVKRYRGDSLRRLKGSRILEAMPVS